MEEPALKVVLMADFFQKVKKRLPEHFREVKDFISGLGYPLELSEFRELKLRPLSRNRLLIEYSVFTAENEWTPSRKLEVTSFRDSRAREGGALTKLKLKDFDSALVEELQFS